MENKNLWDIEDLIKQLAMDEYNKIGLFETVKYLNISQDEVLECFIYLSEGEHPKLNIKCLITCPIHKEILYSYDFNLGLNQIQSQYYCHCCESIIDINAESIYLQFMINKNYLESIKKYKRKKQLEKARELAKLIHRKTEEAGLNYEEIQEDVYQAWLKIRKDEEKIRRKNNIMISIDKAKTLKELGLEWNLKRGDFYLYESLTNKETCIDLIMQDNPGFWCDAVRTWLPSLKQLLAEIEKFNVYWEIEKLLEDNRPFYSIIIGNGFPMDRGNDYVLEDAIADALIWFLENEVNKL